VLLVGMVGGVACGRVLLLLVLVESGGVVPPVCQGEACCAESRVGADGRLLVVWVGVLVGGWWVRAFVRGERCLCFRGCVVGGWGCVWRLGDCVRGAGVGVGGARGARDVCRCVASCGWPRGGSVPLMWCSPCSVGVAAV